MYGNAKQHLTIIGDRQSGRTHILALAAIRDAMQGRNVLWECPTMQRAEESLHEVEHLTYETNAADGVRVVRTNGRYSIEFLAGGQIRFGGPASSSSLWGRSGARGTSRQIDTHIMDDVLSEAHPDATRVYRALLR